MGALCESLFGVAGHRRKEKLGTEAGLRLQLGTGGDGSEIWNGEVGALRTLDGRGADGDGLKFVLAPNHVEYSLFGAFLFYDDGVRIFFRKYCEGRRCFDVLQPWNFIH